MTLTGTHEFLYLDRQDPSVQFRPINVCRGAEWLTCGRRGYDIMWVVRRAGRFIITVCATNCLSGSGFQSDVRGIR